MLNKCGGYVDMQPLFSMKTNENSWNLKVREED